MFKATRALSMQPTRMMAMQPSRMMAMQTTRMMAMRQSPQLFVRQTMALRSPVPKEEHSAHTVSQRLRQLKNIPTEIWPLIVVLGVAIVMAFFSIFRKLWVDKTLRLKRQGKQE
ncbi:hypothetical protein COCSADRAFT_89271 [Bipolaris sorokiniana ND90Pr]|uniref:Uncharacterized protein n=1 Tax=Cochliobolus sativus (strain ND90Pr / ATCC 201652) TaxID=665912 RepID=M2SA34_COCSN|nr:uncharacterized protein COCSADRAFT_89271 [Bipolaris sorokiniana ND90Pr]EMD64163.1 hypothetical protein COCSADRAFT_89271 [Bipolaris sorokiniana ND90Pr]